MRAYSFAMGCWPKNGLLDMNKGLSLQHIGRPHSGIGISTDCDDLELPQGGAPGPTACLFGLSQSPQQHPHRLYTPPPRLL
ncbi:hypothetical protein CB1_000365064 [Camelus ferus]|nr:hypothetical protein CB1_000365064 [Camelus ferus]